MKKILLSAAFIILSAFLTSVKAQDKIKEGKMEFEISSPDSGASKSIMDQGMTVYFKNGDTRTEKKNMRMGNSIIIRYAKSGDTYLLMGNKEAMKMPKKIRKDDWNKALDSTHIARPVTKITDETKTILSFKCRKAFVTMTSKGKKRSYEVWFTKDIDNIDMDQYEYDLSGIDGFVLESTEKAGNMTIHKLCTSFERMKVPDSLVKVPDDYKITTSE